MAEFRMPSLGADMEASTLIQWLVKPGDAVKRGDIAPEAELDQLDPVMDFREQLDLDSMDVLNFVIGIHEATGVEIPEADYPQMASLVGCIAYLHPRIK